jgi:Ser/Thr protein kinase RdoA (MazF antagonist)
MSCTGSHSNNQQLGEVSVTTKFFYDLTPDKILRAVEALGVRCTGRVLQLNSMENRVYEVELDIAPSSVTNPSERFLVVKFYRPGRWTEAQILEEHAFLFDLEGDEIPVIAPLRFDDDRSLHAEAESGIWYCVFPKAGGRSPDELSDDQLDQVGRLLARIHMVGARHPAVARMKLTPQTYGLSNLEYLLGSGALPAEVAPHYEAVVRQLVGLISPWFTDVAVQRIHGDCHLGNLIWGRSGMSFVDFDDMVVGPCVQDIWLMLPGRDGEARRQLRRMLGGYEQMRAFDRQQLRLIEPLRGLRLIHYSAWVARRWEDPAFPRTFPHFGSNQYWREQLADLSEILVLCQEQPFLFAEQ